MVIELGGRPVDGDALSTLALYNYGHFTSMRVNSGGVRGLHLHMSRLQNDCRLLFDHDLDLATVRDLVRHACPEGDEQPSGPAGQCLPGVTMRLLQGAEPFSRQDVYLSMARQMTSAFVTNAAVGVRPVASIDDTEYTVDSSTLADLRRAYEGVAEEQL